MKINPNKIKSKRQEAGFTQRQLASKLNTTHPNVSKWETGRSTPNGVHTVMLLRALNCELEAICDV